MSLLTVGKSQVRFWKPMSVHVSLRVVAHTHQRLYYLPSFDEAQIFGRGSKDVCLNCNMDRTCFEIPSSPQSSTEPSPTSRLYKFSALPDEVCSIQNNNSIFKLSFAPRHSLCPYYVQAASRNTWNSVFPRALEMKLSPETAGIHYLRRRARRGLGGRHKQAVWNAGARRLAWRLIMHWHPRLFQI